MTGAYVFGFGVVDFFDLVGALRFFEVGVAAAFDVDRDDEVLAVFDSRPTGALSSGGRLC